MTPEWDRQARRIQLGKLVARLEAAGLLDKINPKRPVTLALYFGDAAKADLALRWRRQDRSRITSWRSCRSTRRTWRGPWCGWRQTIWTAWQRSC